jgi:serine/threonine protein kinase
MVGTTTSLHVTPATLELHAKKTHADEGGDELVTERMHQAFSALQRSWAEGGKVDSRYEVLLDKVIPYLLDGRYIIHGFREKYHTPRRVDGKVLGSGSNGRILVAQAKSGQDVAVKVTLAMHGAQHEQRMLKHCQQFNINVVDILDTYTDKTLSITVLKLEGCNWSLDNFQVYPLFQGLSYAPLADRNRRVNVRDLYACVKLHSCFGGISIERIRLIFSHLVTSLHALHRTAGISHGDLKLQNVLIDETLSVTIVDLSAARFIKDGWVKRFAGAPSYGSPEAMRGFAFDGEKNDIWSLGIMLYMMYFGADQEPSFTGVNAPLERRSLGSLGVDIYTWSKEHGKKHRLILPARESHKQDGLIRDLISKILDYDMTRRCTLEEIRQHPFLTGKAVERVDSGVSDLEAGQKLVKKPFWQAFFSTSKSMLA